MTKVLAVLLSLPLVAILAAPRGAGMATNPSQVDRRRDDSSDLAIRVSGSVLLDQDGRVVRLLGVNRPGMDALDPEGRCWQIPPNPDEVAAMARWRINAVRIPLNEDCWLGIKRVGAADAAAYRDAVERYVTLLGQWGIYSILDLHRSAPGHVPATSMQAMPDMDHSPAFWAAVATRFADSRTVIFDLYSEPHLADVLPAGSNYWECWRDGCSIDVVYMIEQGRQRAVNFTWQAAGMQQLVDSVRSTGTTQPVMLSGLNYANSLSPSKRNPGSGWLSHLPSDPADQMVASVHVYSDARWCVTPACWRHQFGAVAARYPVVTAEFGEDDCAHGFIDRYMRFADRHGVSYLGWSWSIERDCRQQEGASLIVEWNGRPSASGKGLRAHLIELHRGA